MIFRKIDDRFVSDRGPRELKPNVMGDCLFYSLIYDQNRKKLMI